MRHSAQLGKGERLHPGVDLIRVERGTDHSFIFRTDRFGTGLHLRCLISPTGFAEQGSVVMRACLSASLRGLRLRG